MATTSAPKYFAKNVAVGTTAAAAYTVASSVDQTEIIHAHAYNSAASTSTLHVWIDADSTAATDTEKALQINLAADETLRLYEIEGDGPETSGTITLQASATGISVTIKGIEYSA